MSYAIGSHVRIRPEFANRPEHRTDTYTVVKINPRTLGLRIDRTFGKLNADPEVVMPADETPAPRTGPGTVIVDAGSVTVTPPVPIGAVVTATGLRNAPALLVVVGHVSTRGTDYVGHRLVPLGGTERGTYWTNIPGDRLTVVPMDALAERLIDSL
jgi:hypothetical protein